MCHVTHLVGPFHEQWYAAVPSLQLAVSHNWQGHAAGTSLQLDMSRSLPVCSSHKLQLTQPGYWTRHAADTSLLLEKACSWQWHAASRKRAGLHAHLSTSSAGHVGLTCTTDSAASQVHHQLAADYWQGVLCNPHSRLLAGCLMQPTLQHFANKVVRNESLRHNLTACGSAAHRSC